MIPVLNRFVHTDTFIESLILLRDKQLKTFLHRDYLSENIGAYYAKMLVSKGGDPFWYSFLKGYAAKVGSRVSIQETLLMKDPFINEYYKEASGKEVSIYSHSFELNIFEEIIVPLCLRDDVEITTDSFKEFGVKQFGVYESEQIKRRSLLLTSRFFRRKTEYEQKIVECHLVGKELCFLIVEFLVGHVDRVDYVS